MNYVIVATYVTSDWGRCDTGLLPFSTPDILRPGGAPPPRPGCECVGLRVGVRAVRVAAGPQTKPQTDHSDAARGSKYACNENVSNCGPRQERRTCHAKGLGDTSFLVGSNVDAPLLHAHVGLSFRSFGPHGDPAPPRPAPHRAPEVMGPHAGQPSASPAPLRRGRLLAFTPPNHPDLAWAGPGQSTGLRRSVWAGVGDAELSLAFIGPEGRGSDTDGPH